MYDNHNFGTKIRIFFELCNIFKEKSIIMYKNFNTKVKSCGNIQTFVDKQPPFY